MSKNSRGADVLAGAFSAAGIKRIFTLSGNQIMPVFDACLDHNIELVHVRHEAAAVHMADAWGQLTGEVGVALVTAGPGHANAVSALYTAAHNESPVVLLSGHAPSANVGRGAFQEMPQAALAETVCKAAWVSSDPGRFGKDFSRALRVAQSGRPGPVHMSLAYDALEAKVDDLHSLMPSDADLVARHQALEASIAGDILDAVQGANHPLILTGPLLMRGNAATQCARLADATGVPVIGMDSPRGVNDPRLGAIAELLEQADLIVLLAKPLDFTLRFGASPAVDTQCRFIHVDPDRAVLERSEVNVGDRLVARHVADPKAALDALLETSINRSPHSNAAWQTRAQEHVTYRPSAWQALEMQDGCIHAAALCRVLQSILDAHPDAVLVADGGEFGQWAQACLSAPARLINGPAGAIGTALPYALAARLARPNAPVLAVLGDGTFGFHMAEIDTAVRYSLDILAVVGNDACWNAEYQIQLNAYGEDRLIGCELRASRYDQVAQALGAHGEHVRELAELEPALKRAREAPGPACVNVEIARVAAPKIRKDA